MMVPQHQSLVKYDNPVLVSTSKGRGRKGKLPPVEQKQQLTQTEDILNSILPPREWTAEGQLWVQYVSSTPATRLDVINLQVRARGGTGVPLVTVSGLLVGTRACLGCVAAAAAARAHPSPDCGIDTATRLVRARLDCPQEQLDQKLQQRQARETGICPIREELYAQCFGACRRRQ